MECEAELKALKDKYNFHVPDRGNLDDPDIKWRTAKPVYTKADVAFFKGKSKNHPEHSLERLVENLVKTWEMEASHKIDFSQWTTVDHEKFNVSANGGQKFYGEEAKELGNYNTQLIAVDKELYDSSKETFESSHDLFRGAFKDGFPWEVLNVFSGPPKVVFSWRHWALFNGEYKGRQGDNETYEMFGLCEVMVNENLKVESLEVFYKPEDFLRALEGTVDRKELFNAKNLMGDGCPIVH